MSACRSLSDPTTAVTSAPCSSARSSASRGWIALSAVVNSATRSPATGSTGQGRMTAAITVASGFRSRTVARTDSTWPASASGGSLMVITTTSDTSTR